ncbi:MAG: hypothetical protein IKH15_09165 [Bacteroidales bacterium]|nr:hypothetical protein [Bacteroidales bacterium]
MKIPFTLDAWLKDKSQKVETTFGEEAKIVFTEGLGKRPILAVIYDEDTTDTAWFTEDGKSSDGVDGLFIVTPEPEISEFEKCVKHLMEETIEAGDTHNLKPDSEMLLRMAKQQLLQSGELMTQEHHEKLMETLREECKMDLPRWRIWRNGACGNSVGHSIALVYGAGGIRFVSCLGANGEKYIMLDDLKKLPGFNDEHHE